jgi:hypothetical protein
MVVVVAGTPGSVWAAAIGVKAMDNTTRSNAD